MKPGELTDEECFYYFVSRHAALENNPDFAQSLDDLRVESGHFQD
jgi:hypothetical protein